MFANQIHEALITPYVQQLFQVKARQVVRHRGFTLSDRHDIEQEFAIHVIREAPNFDPSRGSVNTFIDRVVNSAVTMILRERRQIKRAAGFRSRSLDEAFPHAEIDRQGSLGELLDETDGCRRRGGTADKRERFDLHLDMRPVLASLPPRLLEIATRLAENPSERAVARDMGISRRQLRHAMATLRTVFEKAGMKNF